jgi:hypothetical protein
MLLARFGIMPSYGRIEERSDKPAHRVGNDISKFGQASGDESLMDFIRYSIPERKEGSKDAEGERFHASGPGEAAGGQEAEPCVQEHMGEFVGKK